MVLRSQFGFLSPKLGVQVNTLVFNDQDLSRFFGFNVKILVFMIKIGPNLSKFSFWDENVGFCDENVFKFWYFMIEIGQHFGV